MVTDGVDGSDDDLAREVGRLREENDELRIALVTRQLIGQATGVIAGQLGLSTDDAWRVVTVTSSFTNQRIRDVARVVVNAHDRRQDPADTALDASVAAALEAAVRRMQPPRAAPDE